MKIKHATLAQWTHGHGKQSITVVQLEYECNNKSCLLYKNYRPIRSPEPTHGNTCLPRYRGNQQISHGKNR